MFPISGNSTGLCLLSVPSLFWSVLSSAWLGLPVLDYAWEQNKKTVLIVTSWFSFSPPISVYLWSSLVACVDFKLLWTGDIFWGFFMLVSGAASSRSRPLGTLAVQTTDDVCHSSPLGNPSCYRENIPVWEVPLWFWFRINVNASIFQTLPPEGTKGSVLSSVVIARALGSRTGSAL